MNSNETTDLDYLCVVFKGLSMENRDYLLETAKSLMKTQNNELLLEKEDAKMLNPSKNEERKEGKGLYGNSGAYALSK